MEIRRNGEEAEVVEFVVKGRVRDVDKQKIDEVMLANEIEPISVSLEVEGTESDE